MTTEMGPHQAIKMLKGKASRLQKSHAKLNNSEILRLYSNLREEQARNFPVTIGITAGTTAERIPDICLAYIKEAFQQRSAAPELRAEHSRNLKKKTADLSLAFPKGEHAQWEVDNWMLMNQKFSFSENPRGIQEALHGISQLTQQAGANYGDTEQAIASSFNR